MAESVFRDQNNVANLGAASTINPKVVIPLVADPVTGALLVTSTGGGGGDVNLASVGGVTFSLGQQLAAASLPVVLTASQLSTLTPLTSVAVTQSTSPWVTSESALTSLGTAQLNVTTAGSRVQLGTNACKSVTIKAKTTNTGNIFVGNVTVTSANGFILGSGDSISLDVSNTNLIYIDSSVNGEGISYIFAN